MIKVFLIAIMAVLGTSSVETNNVTPTSLIDGEVKRCVCNRELGHAPVAPTGFDTGCNGGWMEY